MEFIDSIVETNEGMIKIVRYNKPKRKNAIDVNMYRRITDILNTAAYDENISMIVLTGTGNFYSSGNDFAFAKEISSEDNNISAIRDYIQAFIMFPKLLVAIVNGPAIGIAATSLALCDLVFAAVNSYFYTPFSNLGIIAEGCSTLTFPRLIGERKAAEMLMYNHKMSAEEALNCGFVNYIYKPEEIQSKVWDKILEVSKLSLHSLSTTKKLMRKVIQDDLVKANERETEELNKIWSSGGYVNTVTQALSKKSKL